MGGDSVLVWEVLRRKSGCVARVCVLLAFVFVWNQCCWVWPWIVEHGELDRKRQAKRVMHWLFPTTMGLLDGNAWNLARSLLSLCFMARGSWIVHCGLVLKKITKTQKNYEISAFWYPWLIPLSPLTIMLMAWNFVITCLSPNSRARYALCYAIPLTK